MSSRPLPVMTSAEAERLGFAHSIASQRFRSKFPTAVSRSAPARARTGVSPSTSGQAVTADPHDTSTFNSIMPG